MDYREMIEPKHIWIIGDLHGEASAIRNFYIQNKNQLSQDFRENVLIVLGDLGANYFLNYRDENFKKALEKFPFTYFAIRGNHEERPSILKQEHPDKWHIETYFNNEVYVEDAHPRILYARDDGDEYNIAGRSTLIVPGAYSVDKNYRLMRGWSWFSGEQLTEDEKNNLFNNLNSHYDIILSHTCPLKWQNDINDLFLNLVDQSTVDNSMEIFLNEISTQTDWQHWYFGHYHDDRDLCLVNATMLFHTAIPFGMSLSGYQQHNLTNS